MDGLLIVQMVVGFEFFWTVLAKLVRGGFVGGLGADLQNRVQAAPSWYRSFADNVVVPHAHVFGYMIIAGELFVGVTLIATAFVWLTRWPGLSLRSRGVLVALIIAAAFAGMMMNINYHVASGARNPWQLADSVFDEGVDLNSVLTMVEATIVAVMIGLAVWLRRDAGGARRGA
jgi:cytochrome bd-type quinol oxidase subunit 1